MKILMFYAPSFWFKTYEKVLDTAPDVILEKSVANAVINIKWLAGKFKTRNIVLHSFNHLSLSKAPPEFTGTLMNSAKERLGGSGFTVIETPFGYLNEWKIHVAGESLAKVFKDI
jgi:hypothetical protein